MTKTTGFAQAINNQDSLARFLAKMRELDQAFCDLMASGEDFNVRLEIRGNQGKVIQCRLVSDKIDRFGEERTSRESTDGV